MVFDCLDEHKNGELSPLDFMKGFKDKFNLLVTEPEMNKIMKDVNLVNPKTISFTEFLMAACNKNNLLTEANLRQMFTTIDDDGDQFITRQDFKKFVNVENDYFIGNLMEEADNDCDGGLNWAEF